MIPIIRPAVPADAEALTTYVTRLVDEPHNNIILDPGQWGLTVDEERDFIQRALDNPNKLFLVAELHGKIVGCANIDRLPRPTNCHVASIGLSVDQNHRRQGIGTALMNGLLGWAKSHGLRRIELKVFTRNTAAIALYKKLGFVQEGLHRMACRKQGIWVDDLTMALFLNNLAQSVQLVSGGSPPEPRKRQQDGSPRRRPERPSRGYTRR